ncbi:MAG: type II toxin-antitoxin system VapC family toxin [Chloroflexi bacterium]|nr:type II toxin-antitoxin system VapC family toxin [Chloroflexota bacterium]
MTSPITIDASVFVNAFSPTESGSDESLEFINATKRKGIPIIVPVLVLPEISAAIARRQNNTDLALNLVRELRLFSNITFVDVDEILAHLAVEIAATSRLRGSDAVYAAVALRFGTELVTLDREQLERLPEVIPVRAP